jgi:diadenylate cyclase
MDSWTQWSQLLKEVGISGILDIAVVTLVIYTFLAALKRTQRSRLIFAGIIILGAIYIGARKLNLLLTVSLLQGFFAVILVALVVIFQEDLRYFFEQVAARVFEGGFSLHKRKTARLPRREVEVLTRTLGDLAREKIGALVVIRGKDPIARHLDGGEEVKGLLSEPLLKSIFDPHSIGHDGAVVIDGRLIDKIGCHLPLSKNFEKFPRSGTRHAAALGLSEYTDALCLVVSEERGSISAARHGDMQPIATPAELANVLEAFYDEIAPQPEMGTWTSFIRRNYREKIMSFGLAVALWVLLGYGSQELEKTFEIPVNYSSLASNLTVTNIAPAKVRVTFGGHRRDFALLSIEDVKLTLPLRDARKGKQRFSVTNQVLSYPRRLELIDIEPRRVLLDVENKPPEEKK